MVFIMNYSERNIKEYVNHIVWSIALRNTDEVFDNINKNPDMQKFGDFINAYTDELSALIIKHMSNELNG